MSFLRAVRSRSVTLFPASAVWPVVVHPDHELVRVARALNQKVVGDFPVVVRPRRRRHRERARHALERCRGRAPDCRRRSGCIAGYVRTAVFPAGWLEFTTKSTVPSPLRQPYADSGPQLFPLQFHWLS